MVTAPVTLFAATIPPLVSSIASIPLSTITISAITMITSITSVPTLSAVSPITSIFAIAAVSVIATVSAVSASPTFGVSVIQFCIAAVPSLAVSAICWLFSLLSCWPVNIPPSTLGDFRFWLFALLALLGGWSLLLLLLHLLLHLLQLCCQLGQLLGLLVFLPFLLCLPVFIAAVFIAIAAAAATAATAGAAATVEAHELWVQIHFGITKASALQGSLWLCHGWSGGGVELVPNNVQPSNCKRMSTWWQGP
mmetsp:Transcript_102003/g.180956  ORF Transcript_102003/g.180956 Transcript_102003/m.180956 type:complete len:251 (-) Transcript_102003:87-839(-)